MKKILEKGIAGLLMTLMLASCIGVFPKDVYATDETYKDSSGVVYIEETNKETVLNHFKNDTAPAYPYPQNNLSELEQGGYLFGGWFTKVTVDDKEKFRPIKNVEEIKDEEGNIIQEAKTDQEVLDGASNYYAKFVPAYVLSVRCQNKLGTVAESGETMLRYIAGLDSTNYAEVGFIVRGVSFDGTYEYDEEKKCYTYTDTEKNLVKAREAGRPNVTTVYRNIFVYNSNAEGEKEGFKRPASVVFGEGTNYMMTYLLKVSQENYARTYAIQPYWVTFDGVMVTGLTKYAHVEDGINKYINVPINLTSTEKVAAGTLTVDFTALAENGYEFMEAECGTVFPEKVVKEQTLYEGTQDERHIIQCVATVANGHETESPVENKASDNIYINLRFERTGNTGNAYDNRYFVELPVSDVEFAEITYDNENNPIGEAIVDPYEVWDVRF